MPRSFAARRAIALAVSLLLTLAAIGTAERLSGNGTGTAFAKKGFKGGVSMVTQSYRLTRPDQTQRLTVECPGRKVPLGGGMITSPPPDSGGEGVYPQSYERLGVQRGWHVTAVLFDRSHASTTPRNIELQVLCTRKFGHVTPPHARLHLKPGQTKTAVATCPGRRHLIGGGFQQTDFTSAGGDYVTESHAISARSWRVTAHAFGAYPGDLASIGYCIRSRKRLITEVSGSTSVAPRSLGTAQTTGCPAGLRLVFGGFSTSPSGSAFFTNGAMNADGTWSASAFNDSGTPIDLTAYGYCVRI